MEVNTLIQILRYMLFEDENGEDMQPVTDLLFNDDESFSFIVENTLTGEKIKHTIVSEEI